MYCKNHPEKEAAGMCVYCGAPFCSDCLVDVNGKNTVKNMFQTHLMKQKK